MSRKAMSRNLLKEAWLNGMDKLFVILDLDESDRPKLGRVWETSQAKQDSERLQAVLDAAQAVVEGPIRLQSLSIPKLGRALEKLEHQSQTED